MRKFLLLCLTALCSLVAQGLWAQTYEVTMTPENNGYVAPGTVISSITFACDDGIKLTTGYDTSYGGGGEWYFYVYDENENMVGWADFWGTEAGGTDAPESKNGVNVSYTFPVYALNGGTPDYSKTADISAEGTYYAEIPAGFYYLGPNYTEGNAAFTYTFTIGTAPETGFKPKFDNVVLMAENNGYNGLTVDITTQTGAALSRNAASSVRASITGNNGLEYTGSIFTPSSSNPETWSIYFYYENYEDGNNVNYPVAITEEGTYTVTFPAEYFKETADETSLSAESSFTFTIGEVTSDESGVEMEYEPADQSQLSHLDQIKVTNGDTGLMWDGDAYSLDDLVITNTETQETYTAIEIEDEGLGDYGAEAQIIHFNKIVKEGTYTITIPKGAFWSGQSDDHNAAATLTYYIDGTEYTGDTNTFEATITTSNASTTGVTLTFEEEVTLVGTENLAVTCGTQSTTASITESGTGTTWTLTFASELTISGTYTIEIPEGYFTNSEEQDIEATTAKFTISIEIDEPTEGTTGSISWPFNEVSLTDNVATIGDNLRGAVTSTVSLGSNISYYGYQEKWDPETQLNYHLAELSRRSSTNSNVDDNSIDFIINITNGCQFTPTEISMQADIVDQTGYVLDVTWIGSDQTIDIASEVFPERNTFITGEYVWEDIYAQPSTSQCKLRFTLSENTGYFFLGNINITGIVEGEFQRTFTLTLDPASGTVTEKLESITVSYENDESDDKMTLEGEGKFEIQDKDGKVVAYAQSSEDATDKVYTLTIEDTEKALETPGTYTLVIPQGSYSLGDAVNEPTTATYIIPDYFTLTFDPEGGTYISLEYISVHYDGGLQFAIDIDGEEAGIKIGDSGYTMYPSPNITNGTATFDIEDSNSSEVEFTNPGTYTITIPEGYFYDSTGTSINKESTVEYTIPSITVTMDTDEAELSEDGTSISLTITAKDDDDDDVDFQVAQSDEMITITTPGENEGDDDVIVAYATAKQDETTGEWVLTFVDEDGDETTITDPGTYTITIPQGYFATDDGVINTKATATFTIEEEEEPEPLLAEGSITWPFTEGGEGQEATISSEIAQAISSSEVTLGSNLVYTGSTRTVTDGNDANETFGETVTFTLFDHQENQSEAAETNAIDFTVTLADGYAFTPSEISLYATRVGTDGCNLNISWIDSKGETHLMKETSASTGDNPGRANGTPNTFTKYTLDLSEYDIDAAEYGTFNLHLNVFGMANGKTFGLSDIIISGTAESVTEDDLYEALCDDIIATDDKLESTWTTIETDYPDQAADEDFIAQKDAIETEIEALQEEVDASYAAGTLTADRDNLYSELAAIQAEIDALLADVIETGINSITIESVGAKGIYTITGQKVSSPTKAGIYIIDGKKVVIK